MDWHAAFLALFLTVPVNLSVVLLSSRWIMRQGYRKGKKEGYEKGFEAGKREGRKRPHVFPGYPIERLN